MDIKKLKKLILPVSVVTLTMFITYFGNQVYAESQGIVGVNYSYIFQGFNDRVPFLSWTIYPYVLSYPFWFFGLIYIGYRSEKNLHFISTIAVISFIICGIWYFFWQSDVEMWRTTSGLFINGDYSLPRSDLSFTESIVMWIYQSAGPRNALPSMHTINSWLVILALRHDKEMPKFIKIFMFSLSILIIVSTQTLKQHYIIDSIAGIFITEGLYWIILKSKFDLKVGHWFTLWGVKWHLIDQVR